MNSYQATPHNSMGRSEGRRLLGNYDADGVDYERRGEGEEDDDEDGEGDDNGALEEQRQAQQAGVAKIEALYRTFGNNRMAVWTLYGAIAGESSDVKCWCVWSVEASRSSLQSQDRRVLLLCEASSNHLRHGAARLSLIKER